MAFKENETSENVTLLEDTKTVVHLVFSSIVMISIIIGAIVGNVLVIVSVMKFERLRSVITNYIIVSLACADLLVAVLAMPFNYSIFVTGKWWFGRFWCDIYFTNDVLFSTASIIHLCLISTDRYIAIVYPLRYESKMTPCRIAIMLCITWTAAVLISYIPINTQIYTTDDNYKTLLSDPNSCDFVVNQTYAIISSTISFWIPCIIMVFLYAKIFREARRQEKHIQSLTPNRTLYSSSPRIGNGSGEFSYSSRRMKREHKAAKTLGIIMGAFILCWLPFFAWYLTYSICGSKRCPMPKDGIDVLFWIGYFNSSLNPIIYAYFNRDFHNAFKRLLHIDSCCRQDPGRMAINVTYTSDHRDSVTYHIANLDDPGNGATSGLDHLL